MTINKHQLKVFKDTYNTTGSKVWIEDNKTYHSLYCDSVLNTKPAQINFDKFEDLMSFIKKHNNRFRVVLEKRIIIKFNNQQRRVKNENTYNKSWKQRR